MIELPIYDSTGKKVDSLKIDEQTLGGEIRHALLKQAYVITHGNQRQGSARTKSRGDIEGSPASSTSRRAPATPAQAPPAPRSARAAA